jgi:hypothetical protein
MDWNAAGFFVFFAVMWLIVTTILAVLSGWFRLMEAFPDQPSDPIMRLRAQSGRIGPLVSMSGVLTLSVCTAGLRVGMMRLFGPFCRDFLVPWQSIVVVRKSTFFGPVAQLQFGDPAVGELRIAGHVADRLASAAMEHWPEGARFRLSNEAISLGGIWGTGRSRLCSVPCSSARFTSQWEGHRCWSQSCFRQSYTASAFWSDISLSSADGPAIRAPNSASAMINWPASTTVSVPALLLRMIEMETSVRS